MIEPEDWTGGVDSPNRAREQRRRSRERRRAERKQARSVRRRDRRSRFGAALAGRGWDGLLTAAVGGLAVVTIVGLVALWPGAEKHHRPSPALGGKTIGARGTALKDIRCPGPTPP